MAKVVEIVRAKVEMACFNQPFHAASGAVATSGMCSVLLQTRCWGRCTELFECEAPMSLKAK